MHTLTTEHRRAVEQLIEERRAQFQREKEAELEERMEEERRESIRRQIIEQERQRLLKEHATKLLGYLPKVSCLVLIILYMYHIYVEIFAYFSTRSHWRKFYHMNFCPTLKIA